MKIFENYNLKNYNTFGFDVVAKKFVEYETEAELVEFLKANEPICGVHCTTKRRTCHCGLDPQSTENKGLKNQAIAGQARNDTLLLHIGSGSNLLFLGDFDGTILHSAIKFINTLNPPEVAPSNSPEGGEQIPPLGGGGATSLAFVRVGAGVVWDDFVAQMVECGFGGAENLSLIPGEVGAAAVQNIGAYGVEIQDIIAKVETIEIDTLQKKIFDVSECKYNYRESIFKTDLKGKFIVTAVVFRLSKNPVLKLDYGALREHLKNIENPNIQDVRNAVIEIRRSKLPDTKILGNAGSFFKNPYCSKEHFEKLQKNYPNIPFYSVNDTSTSLSNRVKLSAAWLIEQCGWKGKTLGGAAVYHLQPLVLVNQGNATPQDVANLAVEIQKSVKEKFNVELEAEVNFV